MQSARLSLVGKIIVVVLALWGLAVVAPDLARLVHPLGTLGFSADDNGVIYALDSSVPGIAASGLVPGDRIDLAAMNCRHFASPGCLSNLAVFGGMGGLQYVRLGHPVVVLAVVLKTLLARATSICKPTVIGIRGGIAHQDLLCTFTPVPVESTFWEKFILLFDELSAFAFIGVGTFFVWRRPCLMTWGFFLYSIWFNPGQYFVAYALLQDHPWLMLIQEILQAIFQGAGYAGFLLFALRFPNDETERRWVPFQRTVPLIGLALALLQLYSFANLFGIGTDLATNATYIAGYIVDLLVIVVLFVRQRAMSPRDRQRTRWVVWGCSIGLTAFIFADMNEATDMFQRLWPNWSLPEWVDLIFYGANAFVPFAVFHALRSYRVVDVRFVASRSVVLLLLWFLCGAVLSEVHRFFVEFLPRKQESFSTIAVILTSILITLLFEKFNDRLNSWCDTLFFRRLHAAEQRLKDVRRALGKSTSYEQIDRALIEEPVAAFGLASGALFRNDGNQTFHRVRGSIGWSRDMLERADASDPVVQDLATHDGVLRLRHTGRLQGQIPSDAAAPALAVSVRDESQVRAVAIYGAHVSGDDLNREEIEALRKLADRAAIAYQSVESQMLRRRVSELSALLAKAKPAEA